MTDTHYKIAEAVRKIDETATERECADLITFSGCETCMPASSGSIWNES